MRTLFEFIKATSLQEHFTAHVLRTLQSYACEGFAISLVWRTDLQCLWLQLCDSAYNVHAAPRRHWLEDVKWGQWDRALVGREGSSLSCSRWSPHSVTCFADASEVHLFQRWAWLGFFCQLSQNHRII